MTPPEYGLEVLLFVVGLLESTSPGVSLALSAVETDGAETVASSFADGPSLSCDRIQKRDSPVQGDS